MDSPQLENGFTPLANELIQAIYKTSLNGTEFRIVLFIIYQTYGYKHKSRQLSVSYISNGTGIPFKSVQRSLKKLVDYNVITAVSESVTAIKTLSINKNYSNWKCNAYLKNEVSEMGYQNCGNAYLKNEVELTSELGYKTIKNKTIKNKTIKNNNMSVSTDTNPQSEFDYQEIVNLFNEICGEVLPKVQKLTDTRKKSIKRAAKELDGDFENFFRKIEKSDFLTGRNGAWTGCNFDWVLKQANLIKIIEGNYDNKKPINSQSSKPDYDEEF